MTVAEMTVHIGFVNVYEECASIPCFPAKEIIFSFPQLAIKTKCTMKENWYETNSRENPVRNKWQPQLLIMCTMWGGTYKRRYSK